MDRLLIIARLLLVGVFVVAGLAKLADRAGSRQAIIDFGLPATLATPLGILLPLVEIAVAIALVPVATVWWGSVGALMLLLIFVAGISLNLVRGRRPDCHCFGQIHSAPVGWPTLARNAVLAGIAGFIVWQGQGNVGPSAIGWLWNLTTGQSVSLICVIIVLTLLSAEGWFLLHLLRQNGRLLLRIEALEARLVASGGAPPLPAPAPTAGLPIGAPAPGFRLGDLYDETLTLDALRAVGKPVLLVFSDPDCSPCIALLPKLARWQREYTAKLTVTLISSGTPEANRAKSAEHGLTYVLLQENREVAQAYQAAGTPTAVLVRPDGTIGSPLAQGAEAISALVVRTVGDTATPSAPYAAPPLAVAAVGNNGNGALPIAPKIDDLAPVLKLPDLTGKIIDLGTFRGRPTLVLFWNPGCGFCQRMLDDLKAWEAQPPKDAPQLLVVSTGTVEANLAMGLQSPLILDQNFTSGRTFGANGTPMAVLIDAEGRVASEVAAGASAVLALANHPHQMKLIQD